MLQVFLARILGTESYGKYTYVLAIFLFLMPIMMLGLDQTVLRYLPSYMKRNEWGLALGFLRRSSQVLLSTSTLFGFSIALLMWACRHVIGEELAQAAIILSVSLPLVLYQQFQLARLKAFKKPILSQVLNQVLRPLLMVAVFSIVVFLWRMSPSAPLAMSAYVVAAMPIVLFGILYLQRLQKEYGLGARLEHRSKEWFGVGVQVMLIASLVAVLNYSDTIILGWIAGTDIVGIYTAAARSAGLIAFGMTAVSIVIAPLVSELYSVGRKADLQRTVTTGAMCVLIVSLPVFLMLIFGGRWVLNLFGLEFYSGYQQLIILSCGQIVSVLCGSAGLLMIMTGRQKELAYITAVSALLSIVLSAGLIPAYGANGAAIAKALTTSAWNIILAFRIYKSLQVDPTVFSILRRFE